MAESKSTLKLAAILTIITFLVMITLNALANALPLNGVDTGQLSDEIPNLFVPAGLTFSIWGLIYALLLGYVTTVLAGAFRKTAAPGWTSSDGWLFSLNALINAGWILAWHWRMVGLAMVLMLGLLVTLILLMERNKKAFTGQGAPTTGAEKLRRFLLSVPILVYLGWICVATIANATALLVTMGWNGFGLDPAIWTIIVIAVGALIGSLLVIKKGAVASGLVVVWAYAGIIIKRWAVDRQDTMPVIVAAAACGLIVLGVSAWKLVAKAKS